MQFPNSFKPDFDYLTNSVFILERERVRTCKSDEDLLALGYSKVEAENIQMLPQGQNIAIVYRTYGVNSLDKYEVDLCNVLLIHSSKIYIGESIWNSLRESYIGLSNIVGNNFRWVFYTIINKKSHLAFELLSCIKERI